MHWWKQLEEVLDQLLIHNLLEHQEVQEIEEHYQMKIEVQLSHQKQYNHQLQVQQVHNQQLQVQQHHNQHQLNLNHQVNMREPK